MTDQERDVLLLEIRAALVEHGERLGRIEQDHGERLGRIEQDHGEKLDRILAVSQGQAAARVTTDERLTVLERRVADLERRAV